MGDKELLELAAKAAIAAGTDLLYSDGEFTLDVWNDMRRWNPLIDDGDAFRMAVKLNLVHSKVFARLVAGHHDQIGDIYSATRRAIVIAAAEIGESM